MKQAALIWTAGIGLAVLAVYGGFGLTRHAIELMDAWKDAAPGNTKPIIANVTTATKAWSDASKQQAQSTTAIERDIRAEMWHLDRTLTTLDGTLSDYGGIPTHLNGVLDSARATSDSLPSLVGDIRTDLQHFTPVEDESRDALASFNRLLSRPSLAETIDGVGATAENAKLISGDLYYWAHPILHPEPCTTAKCKWGRGLGIAGEYLGIGANGGRIYQLFQPTPVRLVH